MQICIRRLDTAIILDESFYSFFYYLIWKATFGAA